MTAGEKSSEADDCIRQGSNLVKFEEDSTRIGRDSCLRNQKLGIQKMTEKHNLFSQQLLEKRPQNKFSIVGTLTGEHGINQQTARGHRVDIRKSANSDL